MPLASDAMVIFGQQPAEETEAAQIAHAVTMKTALHSTVVIDTVGAPLINGFVRDMWRHQPEPAG